MRLHCLRLVSLASGGFVGLFILVAILATIPAARKPSTRTYYSCVPPICARCSYDLSASLNAPACPECGLDWTSATMRSRVHYDPFAINPRAMGRAFLAWLLFCLYAVLNPFLAVSLVMLSYWVDGWRNIDFAKVAHARELRSLQWPYLDVTFFTTLAFLALPALLARKKYRIAAAIVPIALIIDTIFWAFTRGR